MDRMTGEIFEEIYDDIPTVKCFAPAGVILLGEGEYLCCAGGRGVACAAKLREDGKLRFYSENRLSDGVKEYDSDDEQYDGGYFDVPRAVIRAFVRHGYTVSRGADFAFNADEDSTAALALATAAVISQLFTIQLTAQELALIAHFACSRLLDIDMGAEAYLSGAMGKNGSFLLIDPDDLRITEVPVKDCGAQPVILECNEGDGAAPIESDLLKAICDALTEGDRDRLGGLMKQAHLGLKEACGNHKKRALLTEAAWATKGVCGAMMTGLGVLSLVEKDHVKLYIKRMSEFCEDMWDETARIYVLYPCGGAGVIEHDEKSTL